MIFAYFSQEVVLPVASALTAAVGFVMMVGRAPLRSAARGLRSGVRRIKMIFEKWNL